MASFFDTFCYPNWSLYLSESLLQVAAWIEAPSNPPLNRAPDSEQISQPLLQTREITRLNAVYKKLLSNVKTFEGRASLLDKHTVQVENVVSGEKESVTSKYILVATGARAVFIDIPGKVIAPGCFVKFSRRRQLDCSFAGGSEGEMAFWLSHSKLQSIAAGSVCFEIDRIEVLARVDI